MSKPIQKRTLVTRAALIAAAENIVLEESFTALRVEQVVKAAGVAKGTFFAHFTDKDGLMEILLAARLAGHFDLLEKARRPKGGRAVARVLAPLMKEMTAEHYIFDLVQRRAGAQPDQPLTPLAESFARLDALLIGWFGGLFGAPPFRTDLQPHLMAEGVRAFAMQSMSLSFCARHNKTGMGKRFETYLDTFLMPPA